MSIYVLKECQLPKNKDDSRVPAFIRCQTTHQITHTGHDPCLIQFVLMFVLTVVQLTLNCIMDSECCGDMHYYLLEVGDNNPFYTACPRTACASVAPHQSERTLEGQACSASETAVEVRQ